MQIDGDTKHQNSEVTSDSQGDLLIQWIVLTLLGVGLFIGLKKLYLYLKDNFDWDEILTRVFQSMERQMSLKELHPNLDKAEEYINAHNRRSAEAAFLVCATLEKSLSLMATSRRVVREGAEMPRGMGDLAFLLYERGEIDEHEKRRIEEITASIRNPLFHGEFHAYDSTRLETTLGWVRDFVTGHLVYPQEP